MNRHLMRPGHELFAAGQKKVRFWDDFERADTTDGVVTNAPNGTAWDMRGVYAGSYPLPPASYGKIATGRLTCAANQTFYATRTLGRQVYQMNASVSWVAAGGSTALSTVAIIVSKDNKFIDTMLHIVINRGGSNIQKRINGGSFVTMKQADGSTNASIGSPTLSSGGAIHNITVTIAGNTCKLQIDDRSVTAVDNDILTIVGKYVGWEIANLSADMVDLSRIEGVSAVYKR